MPYNAKTNWQHDEVVLETDLNRIEQGIADATAMAEAAQGAASDAQADANAALAAATAHMNSTTGIHGARSEAAANTLIIRDINGRAKVAAPSAADDIARKDTVDAVQTTLNTHTGTTAVGVHGSASAATPNTLMHRDTNGRAKVAAPSAADDIARKDTVDGLKTTANSWTQLQTFQAGIQDGDGNQDVSLIYSVQHQVHTRTTALTYTSGMLTKAEEKNGSTVVKTTTINYDANGRPISVVENAGGVTRTSTLNYDSNGNLTSVTRS